MKHIYYQLILKLKTPLSVGSGNNVNSDSDVIVRKNGTPYIPATAIAGVMGHYIPIEQRKNIFGYISGEKSQKSKVYFYDADLISDFSISIRDSVKLKNKVAVDGSKFDFQIVETGAEFVTYIEINKYNNDVQETIERMISAIASSEIRFGHKTSRGFGEVELKSLKKKEFDLETELDSWLNFDVTDLDSWKSVSEYKISEISTETDIIKLQLKQCGALSIRTYTTDISEEKDSMPDYKHTTLANGIPIIPGTSWAGAFRERFNYFSDEAFTDDVFGTVKEKTNVVKKSQIIFSESVINGYKWKTITRNSIDRFSAATKDGALYTEQTCYDGKTELKITIPKKISEKARFILSACIADLNNGLLSVGGLTSIGRGIFEVEKITLNGADKTKYLAENDIKNLLIQEKV